MLSSSVTLSSLLLSSSSFCLCCAEHHHSLSQQTTEDKYSNNIRIFLKISYFINITATCPKFGTICLHGLAIQCFLPFSSVTALRLYQHHEHHRQSSSSSFSSPSQSSLSTQHIEMNFDIYIKKNIYIRFAKCDFYTAIIMVVVLHDIQVHMYIFLHINVSYLRVVLTKINGI